MKLKKTILLTVLALAFALPVFAAGGLPEIGGWQCGELRVTKLDTVSGNKGQWLERDYRTAAGTPFHAVWIDGAGEKNWNVQTNAATNSDGAGASYTLTDVSGNKAVLERQPVTGISLTVKIDKLGTLTLESNNATTDEEITSAAVSLIKAIH